MISLGSVTWHTKPTIVASFGYEKKRVGADMQYRTQVTISTVSGSSYFGYPIYLGLYIGGEWRETVTVKAVNPYRWTSEIVYTSGWYTVAGKTSGTTPVSFNLYSGLGYSYSQTYDYTMAVDPAASFLSVSNGTLGTAQTVEVKWYDSTFKHKITYSCGSASGYVAGSASSYAPSTKPSWTPPISLATQNTTGLSVSVSLTVYTYTSGGTLVGTSTSVITCAIPASVKPSCTCTLEDITGIGNHYGSPVQGLSKIKVTVNATLAQGSPIKAYSISINGARYTTNPATTGVLVGESASVVTVTVTDGRNRTSDPWTYDMNVQNYTPPSVSKLTVKRCNADGTENDQGQYVQATFSAAVSSMNSKNTATCVLRYKKSSTDNWTEKDFSTTNPYTYTYTNKTHIFSADESSSYDVELVITDRHGTASRSTSASTAYSLIDYHTGGRGIRFGGVAEDNDLFRVSMPAKFDDPVRGKVFGLGTLELIPDNGDLNDYVVSGVYSVPTDANAETIGNLPRVTAGRLIVSDSTGTEPADGFLWEYKEQLFLPHDIGRGGVPWVRQVRRAGTEEWVYYDWHSYGLFSYPVGSIYISRTHESPAALFGGTWTRIENRFLWATTSGGTMGQTGGAQTHTHTLNNAWAKLGFSWNSTYKNAIGGVFCGGDLDDKQTSFTSNMFMGNLQTYYWKDPAIGVGYGTALGGNTDSASNMPPYVQVSIWWRTA